MYVWEFKDKLSGNTGEFANEIEEVFADAQGYPTALGKSPGEILMKRQPRLRFTVLRDKSLKQHYVKRKCKEKPKTVFGPTFADLNKVGSILANVIYNNQVFTSTKLRLSIAFFFLHLQ